MGCVAVLFGLLAYWMWWIVATCLDEDGWFDFLVGMVIHEVILAVGLLALVLLIWAIFASARLGRVFETACAHAAKAAAVFFALLIAPPLLFAVVWSVLTALGIVE
jgi:hypothetical protein